HPAKDSSHLVEEREVLIEQTIRNGLAQAPDLPGGNGCQEADRLGLDAERTRELDDLDPRSERLHARRLPRILRASGRSQPAIARSRASSIRARSRSNAASIARLKIAISSGAR